MSDTKREQVEDSVYGHVNNGGLTVSVFKQTYDDLDGTYGPYLKISLSCSAGNSTIDCELTPQKLFEIGEMLIKASRHKEFEGNDGGAGWDEADHNYIGNMSEKEVQKIFGSVDTGDKAFTNKKSRLVKKV